MATEIETEHLKEGETISLLAEYIDEVFYGTYLVKRDFDIETNTHFPNSSAEGDVHCANYVDKLVKEGFIEKVEIREVYIGRG